MTDENERKLRDSLATERWAAAKKCAGLLEVEEWGTDAFEVAAFGLWFALSGSQKESLDQIMFNGPIWDGDHISKSARDDLFKLGLASRCCYKGESGFTVATYRAETVYRAAGLHKQRKLDKLREERNEREYDALKSFVVDKAAVAPLTPAQPEQHLTTDYTIADGTGDQAELERLGEADEGALAEFMKRPGAVKWEGGMRPVPTGTELELLWKSVNGVFSLQTFTQEDGWYAGGWGHAQNLDHIVAYRIISDKPSEGFTGSDPETWESSAKVMATAPLGDGSCLPHNALHEAEREALAGNPNVALDDYGQAMGDGYAPVVGGPGDDSETASEKVRQTEDA